MYKFLGKLPRTMQRFLLGILPPLWLLPSKLFLKTLKEDNSGESWGKEFEMEMRIAGILKPLQGTVVPIFYGEVQYSGMRALLFSDIGGFPLNDPDAPEILEPKLSQMLNYAFAATLRLGAQHGDTRLDNIHLVGDRIMIVDWEMGEHQNPHGEYYTTNVQAMQISEVNHLLSMYSAFRKSLVTTRK